jgi:hypothetical protein
MNLLDIPLGLITITMNLLDIPLGLIINFHESSRA